MVNGQGQFVGSSMISSRARAVVPSTAIDLTANMPKVNNFDCVVERKASLSF